MQEKNTSLEREGNPVDVWDREKANGRMGSKVWLEWQEKAQSWPSWEYSSLSEEQWTPSDVYFGKIIQITELKTDQRGSHSRPRRADQEIVEGFQDGSAVAHNEGGSRCGKESILTRLEIKSFLTQLWLPANSWMPIHFTLHLPLNLKEWGSGVI